jgi:hypothetical protein
MVWLWNSKEIFNSKGSSWCQKSFWFKNMKKAANKFDLVGKVFGLKIDEMHLRVF